MAKELKKVYEPQEVEDRLYAHWEELGCFKADNKSKKEPFTVVIPPPNVTGQLHMGHAMDETIQDILIRYKKLRGYETLWLPGTDHAGIATQIKVEEMLRKEGLTRYDLGREAFLERVWAWKEKYGSTIINQLKKLGSACDWSRERFTMDEGCSAAVRKVFVDLYEKGLIYQGNRIINWCPNCKTALSDVEVEYTEKEGRLWHIEYKVKDSDEVVVCATTRPETMLGDTGIAVNPNDKRYTHLVGKTAILPLVGREIPVFADDYVEMEFGTGCVKVTPSHDPDDFEMGQRHGLDFILVIDENGRMTEGCGKYAGMDRYEARRAIVEDLEAQGLLRKVEELPHNVGVCYRCGTDVEPMTSTQWFVKMKPLAQPAIEAVRKGDIRFVPSRFENTYFNWMENVRDWCISRQLWWGHRIPAFYCDTCGKMFVSREDLTVCPDCGAPVRQDEDVLDTWFSSALWPFSTLGWPEKTDDLAYFYPTSTLVTGYDIIFFWVARMIFSGLEHMGQKPFSDVLIHGLVRDAQGRKMSKSLGNGVDPLEIIKLYGADALRFTLITGNSPGNDTRFSADKVEAARNFANKIWNASRFVLMNLEVENTALPPLSQLEPEDKWILSKMNRLVEEVTENLESYDLGVALSKLYDFFWDSFCDWYIELCKARLFAEDDNRQAKLTAQSVLAHVLFVALRLLHPFMPFITEELYLSLPHEKTSIMFESWPKPDDALRFSADEADMEKIMGAINAIRARRSEMNVPPSRRAALFIETKEHDLFAAGIPFFQRLAGISEVSFEQPPADVVTIVTDGARLFIPLGDLVDFGAELARLQNEKKKLHKEIERAGSKLNNPGFLAKAPAEVVEEEKTKLEKFTAMLEKVDESIAKLSDKQ
ncbi:MAG TPA: valine--tRNA ligase [Candidatus Galloscillospira excrementipullorum]|nr:valine--tRNA ligase [Candidatus Galloscillospira excrementipullorum]